MAAWYEDIWDRATGIFDRIADLELASRELELARDVELVRRANAAETEQRYNQAAGGVTLGGLSPMHMLLIGGGLLLVLLLARRR